MERARLNRNALIESDSVEFISSGSYLLDRALGGGWAGSRVINIVGDSSSGKTLLAIEACINFALAGSAEYIRYGEAEEALDDSYAERMGLPRGIQRTKSNELRTVEAFSIDLMKFLKKLDGKHPALYVLDSLDSLSNAAELGNDLGDQGYGTAKPKLLSEFFRRIIGELTDKRCTLLIISQLRDNIGVMFGEKSKRAGGRALNFYASDRKSIRKLNLMLRSAVAEHWDKIEEALRPPLRKYEDAMT
jgi:recombination protein RecA